MFQKENKTCLADPSWKMRAEVIYKWLQSRGQESQPVTSTAAGLGFVSSLIEYLQNAGGNVNLAFVTVWQTFREHDEMGSVQCLLWFAKVDRATCFFPVVLTLFLLWRESLLLFRSLSAYVIICGAYLTVSKQPNQLKIVRRYQNPVPVTSWRQLQDLDVCHAVSVCVGVSSWAAWLALKLTCNKAWLFPFWVTCLSVHLLENNHPVLYPRSVF